MTETFATVSGIIRTECVDQSSHSKEPTNYDNPNTEPQQNDGSCSKESNDISALTLAINTVNNVLTWATIAIGVITLFVAIYGLVSFRNLKKDLSNKESEIDKKILTIQSDVQTINNKTTEIINKETQFQQKQEIRNLYFQNINLLLNRLSTIYANQTSNADSNNSFFGLEVLHHYHLISLFLTEYSSNNDSSFLFLSALGTENDVKYLQCIADNDDNQTKRKKASETIGSIQGRMQSN